MSISSSSATAREHILRIRHDFSSLHGGGPVAQTGATGNGPTNQPGSGPKSTAPQPAKPIYPKQLSLF